MTVVETRATHALSRFADYLPFDRRQTDGPGGLISVRHRTGWFSFSFGTNFNSDGCEALDSLSVWPAGSLAKQFTALTLLRLLNMHGLPLTTKAAEVIPEWRCATTLNIGHLLYHQSGLSDEALVAYPNEPTKVALAAADLAFDACPDAGFNYANANYILLAEIVARLAECPFTDAVSQKVLIPAGLDCSAFDMSRLTVVGARWLLNDWCCTPTVSSMPGPGGMYLSLRQLQRWQAALHDGTFEEAVLAQLNTAGRLPDGALGKYGGGQFVLRRGEQEFYCHLGKDGPVSTYLLRTSHPDMAMIALANGDCSNISQICWDIFPRVYL